ncbi:MAG TPA: 4Fe-4S binding protein [Spirochaetota bacterium]|nr:4Fe-4S binding protein [Spirochaetota bacterium]HOM11465.1 4Fe-4S binding protein [Spirochaetota bacterium]
MSKNNYLKLARLAFMMNSQSSSSIPVTFTLLKVFDSVLSPQEVDFLLSMGKDAATSDAIFKKVNMPYDKACEIFSSLIAKGMIWSKVYEGQELFSVSPIMLGWFEVYLCNGSTTSEKREFAHYLTRLFNSWKKYNVTPLRQLRNWINKNNVPHNVIKPASPGKKIVINEAIVPETSQVLASTSINELIARYSDEGLIAVVHCFCRQWKTMEGIACRLKMPLEACIVLGKFSEHAVKYGFGRFISKEEAAKIIDETKKKGGVHIVWHDKDQIDKEEIAICNCCWDCCGVLGSYNRGINSLHFKTFYCAYIMQQEKCTGCGLCVTYCPVGAITLQNNKPVIDKNVCIGCLQCYHKCKKDVIAIQQEEREVFLPLLKPSRIRVP